ncbi:MAG TPA: NADPH:quinone reductase [Sporichthyaceae bacterium]|jgi:NADPH2:quinone reductase|nr:NADPH:quinone reductase [Sporichthyaceae bacterium]
MRAVRYEREGSAAEVLTIGEIDRPAPGPGQVLVRVEVSGINPSDVKTRAGLTPRPIDGFQIPHMDGAGEIVEVGPGVPADRVGQRVWLWLAAFGSRWGTAAEYTVLDATQAVPLPGSGTAELGACLGIPALTAHQCLFSHGPLDGRRVLVHGGAGAVGHFAIELARWAGADVVATASTEDKAAQASAAGASAVVDYRSPEAAEAIRKEGPIDLVVDVAVATNWDLDVAVLRPGGAIVAYATDGKPLQIPVRPAMIANLRLTFFLLYTHPRAALERAAASISQAIGEGALTPLPVTSFGLADAVAAHEAVESGTPGKVLLDLR